VSPDRDGDTARTPMAESRSASRFSAALVVLVVGLVVTGVLTWLSAAQYSKNEARLLRLRAGDAASEVTAIVPAIQTPLASAAALANATGGDRAKFMQFIAPYVGTGANGEFVSASLWRVGAGARGPVAVVGAAPALAGSPAQAQAFLARAAKSSTLSVIGLFQGPAPRLGYGFTGVGVSGPFAAYGESALPRDRYSAVQSNSAFSDLNYAVYLGRSRTPSNLLATSARQVPLPGHPTVLRVPFGDSVITLAVTARGPLEGSLPQRLPWLIAIAGLLLTAGATMLTARLIARRRHAEQLALRLEDAAEENQRLYDEQRGIAQTLQRALLPDALPQPPGLQVGARYEPGVRGVEVGGDWYDLIVLDQDRLLLVVGDVSGRGLRAAATMASLRYAIRAYAAQGDPPATILSKLSALLSVKTNGQLATVLCALVDRRAHAVSITSAGHLPPLLIRPGRVELVSAPVGIPVGVESAPSYTSTDIPSPPGATLIAFTDGLVERRGESIEVGLARLRERALENNASLEDLLARLVDQLRDDGTEDDTAIAGIRWLN
jgi:serine phosphatase RsbU (regulator of sigma subunit)